MANSGEEGEDNGSMREWFVSVRLVQFAVRMVCVSAACTVCGWNGLCQCGL